MDRDWLTAAGRTLRDGSSALADLLLPRTCVACERLLTHLERDLVCGACWLAAAELPRPRCHRCGHPCATGLTSIRQVEQTGLTSIRQVEQTGLTSVRRVGQAGLTSVRPVEQAGLTSAPSAEDHHGVRRVDATCRWCELLPPYVRSARSAYAMPGGAAERVVHALKYEGWSAVARPMARRMASLRFPEDVERERAGLVPVPLSTGRLRERGYNQSAELARWLGGLWGLPVLDTLLVRTRATQSQTRLTPGERHRNVAGAFRPHAGRDSLRGKHLVLVDDVVTTAATLNACAAALHDGGARILSFVTFGRAPAVGDRW